MTSPLRPHPASRSVRRARVLGAALAAACLVAACSHDGRTMPPAAPGRDQSIVTSSTTSVPATEPAIATVEPAPTLQLTLPWTEGGIIPAAYTCTSTSGTAPSPAVSWTGAPDGTVEMAIVMTDPTAGGYVHWIVTGLDPAVGGFADGAVPATAVQVAGSGGPGYVGPCPPAGERHNYVVELFALGQQAEVAPDMPAAEAVSLIRDVALATTQISAFFPAAS